MTLLDITNHAGEPADAGPVIELRDLTRTFAGTEPVRALREASLRVGRGEYVSVVNPSGSGRSTELHILGLLDRPTSGDDLLDGVPTSARATSTRRRPAGCSTCSTSCTVTD